MHVPLPFVSIDPGQRAAEFGDKIIALRLVAVPPPARDALGTRDQREPAFRHGNDPVQQPCRPRPGRHELVRIPFARLDALPGVLGAVVGVRRDAVHRLPPEPRAREGAAAPAGPPGGGGGGAGGGGGGGRERRGGGAPPAGGGGGGVRGG